MSLWSTKTCFICRITQKISDALWAMLGNGWKYIFNCVLWFISVIVNFNALCDTYTVYRHYTVFLKSNRAFSFLIKIIIGNYFLMVSNKIEEHFWLHFVCFLNQLSISKEIRCHISSYRCSNNLNATLSSLCWKVLIIYSRS